MDCISVHACERDLAEFLLCVFYFIVFEEIYFVRSLADVFCVAIRKSFERCFFTSFAPSASISHYLCRVSLSIFFSPFRISCNIVCLRVKANAQNTYIPLTFDSLFFLFHPANSESVFSMLSLYFTVMSLILSLSFFLSLCVSF